MGEIWYFPTTYRVKVKENEQNTNKITILGKLKRIVSTAN